MGCRVVLQATLDAPERVAGLVLIDSSKLGSGEPTVAEAGRSRERCGDWLRRVRV
jgi:pimeloyl-ACP methyl ester carboxylesterase